MKIRHGDMVRLDAPHKQWWAVDTVAGEKFRMHNAEGDVRHARMLDGEDFSRAVITIENGDSLAVEIIDGQVVREILRNAAGLLQGTGFCAATVARNGAGEVVTPYASTARQWSAMGALMKESATWRGGSYDKRDSLLNAAAERLRQAAASLGDEPVDGDGVTQNRTLDFFNAAIELDMPNCGNERMEYADRCALTWNDLAERLRETVPRANPAGVRIMQTFLTPQQGLRIVRDREFGRALLSQDCGDAKGGEPLYAPLMRALVREGAATQMDKSAINEMRRDCGDELPDDEDVDLRCIYVDDDMRSAFPELNGIDRVMLECGPGWPQPMWGVPRPSWPHLGRRLREAVPGVTDAAAALLADCMPPDMAARVVHGLEQGGSFKGYGPGRFDGEPVYSPLIAAMAEKGHAQDASEEEMRTLQSAWKAQGIEFDAKPLKVVEVDDDLRSMFSGLRDVRQLALETDDDGHVLVWSLTTAKAPRNKSERTSRPRM